MPPTANIHISRAETPAGVRLLVRGYLDIDSARELLAAVETARERHANIELDLSEVSFMDSSGLQALMYLVRQASAEGWTFGVRPSFQPAVVKVLELTGVLGTLPVLDQ